MASLLDIVPKPLFEDIARGRWFPVVGAGLSRNAVVPFGDPPPDWNGLAASLKAEIADPEDAVDAVDVISAYEQEHGRPALIERVARAIRLADAAPGGVHRELCRLPLELMMTTNFDNLLEDGFKAVSKPAHPVLDEAQLGLNNPFTGPTLLKIHGDVSRPQRMVLTEGDFDMFLARNPLLSTVVASQFAQRSVVLIGYSLSDPDLRQLLGVVRERLGAGARAIYALEVDASPAKVAKFERRHVRVINLPGTRSDPGPTLERLFRELYEEIGKSGPARLVSKTHEGGLAIRAGSRPSSCFLASSLEGQPDFFEWLGPVSARRDVPLLTSQDFVAPGDTTVAAIDSMLAAAGCAIVEQTINWTRVELGMAINRLGAANVLVVLPQDAPLLSDAAGLLYVKRPQNETEWAAFAAHVENWWADVLQLDPMGGRIARNTLVGEIIELTTKVELILGDVLKVPERQRTLTNLVRALQASDLVFPLDVNQLWAFVQVRNRAAHGRPLGMTDLEVRQLMREVGEMLEIASSQS